MATVEYTARVRRNLREIGDHIARDDPDRAVTFIVELKEVCESLRDFLRRFKAVLKLGLNARQGSYRDYLILYDVVGDTVTINAIVHGARDLDAMDF